MGNFSGKEKKMFRVIMEHGRHWMWHRNLMAENFEAAMQFVQNVCGSDLTSLTITEEPFLERSLWNFEFRMAGHDPKVSNPFQLESFQGVQCLDIRTPPEPRPQDIRIRYPKTVEAILDQTWGG